jgi:hypothetical protein
MKFALLRKWSSFYHHHDDSSRTTSNLKALSVLRYHPNSPLIEKPMRDQQEKDSTDRAAHSSPFTPEQEKHVIELIRAEHPNLTVRVGDFLKSSSEQAR